MSERMKELHINKTEEEKKHKKMLSIDCVQYT